MADALFTPDYKSQPFWWDGAPPPTFHDTELPAAADVVVIGSGYTGLCAAIQTARGGRDTVVIDAENAGWGCSSRNGGQVSAGIGRSYKDLERKHGSDTAYGIVREGLDALQWIGDFIGEEGISCGFRRCGRYYGAHSPRAFESLVRKYTSPAPKGLETGCYVVPPDEQHREINTAYYHGGVVHPNNAGLDPAQYQSGLIARALGANARIITQCPAHNVEKVDGGHIVHTGKGVIRARDVIVATNGYTGNAVPWLHHRTIPLASYILATEPLADDVITRLLPSDRMIVDSREMVVYYRTCPERRRILFGGRVSASQPDAHKCAPALHAQMTRIFPELSATRISHMWMGFVAFSFDFLPHIGRQDGLWYAMGYCGSGVALASYLGTKLGKQVLGDKDGDSPLSRPRFESRPYYWGKPWFMTPVLHYYKFRDWIS